MSEHVPDPPIALDAEESVLGAMMMDPDAITHALPALTLDHFAVPAHRHIFTSIRSLRARGTTVDLVTVAEDLQAAGKLVDAGGPVLLQRLVSGLATSAAVMMHVRILTDYDRRRKLIRLSRYVDHVCNNGGLDIGRVNHIAGAIRSLTEPKARKVSSDAVEPPFALASQNVVDLLLDTSRPPSAIIGDGLLRPRQFGLIYGVPGIGKTWVLLELLLAAALGKDWYGIPCSPVVAGLASLELESWDLRERMKSLTLARGYLDPEALDGRIWFVSPPAFDGTIDLTTDDGVTALESWIKRHGIQLAIVDTLARSHSAEEKDLRPVSEAALGIARRTGCAILFCHHVRKPAPGARAGAGGMFEARGDSRFLADARLVIGLEAKDELIRMTIEKTNTGPSVIPIWISRDHATGVLSRTDGPTDRKVAADERKGDMRRMLEEAGDRGLSSGEIAKLLGVNTRTVTRYATEMGAIVVGKARATRIRIATQETGNSDCRDSSQLYGE